MFYIIAELEFYIDVTFKGFITGELLKLCIKEEASLENFPDKNDIYDFRNANLAFSGYELPAIVRFIRLLYPPKVTRSKTAFVVSSGLQKAIAETFKDIASNLPFEIKIFWDKDSAINWVKNSN